MNDEATTQEAPPAGNDWGSHNHVRTLVLMGATGFGVYLCYLLAAPFLPALAGTGGDLHSAATMAGVESPVSKSRRFRRTVLVIALIVVAPATFVVQKLVVQAANGVRLIETKVESGEWRRANEAQPRLAPFAVRIEEDMNLPGAAKTLATWLSATAGSIVTGSVFQAISFCLVFYLLFFFLRDRRTALHSIRLLSPLSKSEMEMLFDRVGDTIHATVYGTLAVSCIQGLLGGLMFWWLGLPAPLLWGVVMALLAVVPVLGAFVIWIPAALFLVLEGNWGKALILTAWGVAVVGTIDNLLRPVLVGNRLKLHTVLAFLSVVGGLMVFGPAGLILGPMALTITTVLMEIWTARAAIHDSNTSPRTQPAQAPGAGTNRAMAAGEWSQ